MRSPVRAVNGCNSKSGCMDTGVEAMRIFGVVARGCDALCALTKTHISTVNEW